MTLARYAKAVVGAIGVAAGAAIPFIPNAPTWLVAVPVVCTALAVYFTPYVAAPAEPIGRHEA